jgi:S1-C subfamily serine protease
MLFRFPAKFCDDSRPYWALFGLFIVSIFLLVFTLYTKQPERYNHITQWFSSGHSRVGRPMANAQASQFALPAATRKRETEPAKPRRTLDQFLGMTVGTPLVSWKQSLAKKGVESGVVVIAVQRNSIAWQYGLRRNDVIVSINRRPLHTLAEFEQAISVLSPRRGLVLDVYRGGDYSYITIAMRRVAG